jgi:hypothetical protein
LVWFDRKPKKDQDTLIVEWIKYAKPIKGRGRAVWYNLPYMVDQVDVKDPIVHEMKSCGLCTLGIQAVMHIGPKRWRSKKEVARTVGVVPAHKSKGRKSHNAVKDSDVRGFALKEHFEYLLELGECRATRVIATLVDGKTGHTNRDDTVNMVYLPISMGY